MERKMKKTSATDFEREMQAEIKRRVEIIESDDYDFGIPFSKGNWCFVGILFVISVALIVVGAVLAH